VPQPVIRALQTTVAEVIAGGGDGGGGDGGEGDGGEGDGGGTGGGD
jgi:hypothetical protein